ncbi:hypothetical protein [Lentzea sp. NPDC051838]|uniref:hypothetical protein n=1 Tax=Lentzea sp. NPDC051838 TaxID=3154849 RepID=UPI0034428CFA
MSGLWEAWRLWGTGASTQQFVLWGMPLLWWGRAGKVAQFVAGLAVLLDLIGPVRLRTWAQGSAGVAMTRLRQLRLLATLDAWDDFRQHGLSGVSPRGVSRSERARLVLRQVEEQEEFREHYRVSATVEALVLWAILGFFIAGIVSDSLMNWTIATVKDDPWLLVFLPLLYVPGFAFYVVSLLGSLLGAAFGFVVLRPLAWLLDRENPGYHVRWFAFFLFVAGFHFDLLAS